MAYNQTHQQQTLFGPHVHAALEKRGVELLGLALVAASALLAMVIMSYSPEDPSWLSASDAPVQNMLGVPGATMAAPSMLILGWSCWAIATLAAAWGIRCLLHKGAERAFGRLIFAPIMIALASIYAASLVPVGSWSHSFGMGGLFGDTVLRNLLATIPLPTAQSLLIISLVSGISVVISGLYTLGFSRPEVAAIFRFLLVGLVVSYAALMRLLGVGARGAFKAAASLQQKEALRKVQSSDTAPQSMQTQIKTAASQSLSIPRAPEARGFADDDRPARIEKPSFLSRMPTFSKRGEQMPEPELVEHQSDVDVQNMPGDARISARISDVVKSRMRRDTEPASSGVRVEPALSGDHMDIYETDDVDMADPEPLDFGTTTGLQRPKIEAKKVVQPPLRKPMSQSLRAKEEAQPRLQFEESASDYELPPLGLLANPVSVMRHHLSDEALEENARLLEAVLDDYGVKGEIVSVRPGPVVTMYELEPAPGLKASRVIGLADDIARSMSALSARVSTVPGRSVIGIELPNENREKVVLREILSAKSFGDSNQKLPLALGKDIGGEPMVANLAKMPHLLIAGTTGSGKSVAINTMILSLLYKLTPEECRMIMIDPKMLELSVYDGIPHLLSPVVTDPKKAVVALKWVVGEMEERYRKMSKMGVRNIDGYNGRVEDAQRKGEMFSRTVQTGFEDATGEPIFETEEFAPEKMPYIVVVVDEMADLMMVAGKEIEACIQRLAQMARASGIHLIMATQRPSVDVITGTIKANFPTRISFQVTSKIDSRTILGEMGAEQLLGMGDMLYMAGGSKITRCHGPFVSDEEVEEIVNHLKSHGPPDYKSGVVEGPDEEKADNIDMVLGLGGNTDGENALYDEAVAIVLRDRKCSTSYIQRKLAIGYNKAARLVEQMEDAGLVSASNHVGKREILVPEQQ
ncbi:MAG: DNA translocase FtsK 4TM domain-containing protein [Paracoccaceae bacterium]|nr:DNA translocase FtsK 4TM domain-containing protein [Paracoccaceae bacterium]